METPVREILSLAGDLRELRARGLLSQDLLAVAAGLKPVCRFGLPDAEPALAAAALRRFAARAGLGLRSYRSRFESPGKPMVLLGSPAAAAAFLGAARAKERSCDLRLSAAATVRMGRGLGYPDCCVAAFAESEKSGPKRALPLAVRERSGPGPYPRLANFLYNLHSRTPGPGGELGRMLHGGYAAMEAYLLPWVPCRFDCPSSLAYAASLLGLLAKVDAGFTRALEEHLGLPVVWLDDWRFAPLSGARRAAGRWRYSRALRMGTLLEPRLLGLLDRGDGLAEGSEGLCVLKGTRRLGRLPRGAVLFSFR